MFESRASETRSAAAFPRLLADIGGTNARFGWQSSAQAPISDVRVLPCVEHPTLLAAVTSYLAQQGLRAPPSAAFGIANPVVGDRVAMTNHHWAFSIHALREALGIERLLLLNDFTALALSLPLLPDQHKRQLGGTQAVEGAALALLGPGTGLGVSGLLPLGYQNKWIPISGEGGHVSLGASSELEYAALAFLRQRYGHVSAERVLSGPGVVDLYHALCAVRGQQGQEVTSPAQVMALAGEPDAGVAAEVVDLFCALLGSVAGDLALTLGARGGVYIGGGIAPRLGKRLDASPFRARFEAKGRFESYLRPIPVWVIESPVSPALLGASQALSLGIW